MTHDKIKSNCHALGSLKEFCSVKTSTSLPIRNISSSLVDSIWTGFVVTKLASTKPKSSSVKTKYQKLFFLPGSIWGQEGWAGESRSFYYVGIPLWCLRSVMVLVMLYCTALVWKNLSNSPRKNSQILSVTWSTFCQHSLTKHHWYAITYLNFHTLRRGAKRKLNIRPKLTYMYYNTLLWQWPWKCEMSVHLATPQHWLTVLPTEGVL